MTEGGEEGRAGERGIDGEGGWAREERAGEKRAGEERVGEGRKCDR